MRLQIKGGTKIHQRHCRQFARFFCKKFFSKSLNKQITIALKFVKKPKIKYGDECGYVEWVDNNRQPRRFSICINTPPK